MSSFSTEQVDRLAKLARLELSDAEKEATAKKLDGIFGLIEQMQSVDTAGVVPMPHPQELFQRLRADAVTEENRRDLFQAVAPETEEGLYLVPQVIGSE